MDDATRTAAVGGSEISPATTASSSRLPAPLRYRDRERYEMRGEQGRGGLGLVLRAHDRELGRDVAVKELLNRGNASELRFFREALITSRLEHPGIVPVHEAGRWSDGTPFYTMKLVGGRSLHALLDEQRTLEGRLAYLSNVIAVADAIAYAHDHGVIHRDLKPSNVMVGDFGETIVIDWGLAKVLDDSSDSIEDEVPYRSPARSELTAVGSVLGTPAYMAPEQYAGRADHRSDIYALGGILHQLLTGRPPHGRSATGAVAEPELQYARKTPADLIAIAKRALAREPTARYQSAREFADDLKRYTRRDRVAARRYSLAARIALAFARHRTVALVLMAALVVLAATSAVALLNIRGERAQAIAAREEAVINSAAAMLERDPTRAWQTLKAVPRGASPALLRARIQAAGVADRTVLLPGRFDKKQVLASGDRVVVSTGERTLHVLDTRTGELVQLADALTEPVVWSATEDRVYFVRETSHLAIGEVPISGGAVVEIARLTMLPRYMFASDAGAFWLSTDGVLHHSSRGKPPRVVAQDVGAFMVFGSEVVICSNNHELSLGLVDKELSHVGACDPDGAWSKGPAGFFHSARTANYLYAAGKLRRWPVAATDAMKYAQLTDAGLVAGIGADGDGLLLRAGTEAVEHVQLSGTPQIVAAMRRRAGWVFADGRIEVFDTVDGRYWSIQATPGMPWCFGFLTEDRLMTCDRQQVRLWTLPHSAPGIVTTLPTVANNVVFDVSDNALLDGIDGRSYLIKRGEQRAVPLHAHDDLSFGVAWCDSQACSAGWDGRVMCTDLATGSSRVAAELHSVAPWLAAGNGHCFTAAASGGVFDLRSSSQPVYEHRHEPYRMAVSPDGRYVASGDWGGDLAVYDVIRRELVATRHAAHSGRVTNVDWTDGYIISSGSDGVLQLWTPLLVRRRSWQMRSAIRYLDAASGTIGATLDDGSLWMLSTRGTPEHQVVVDAVLTNVAVSPNGAFVAAGTNGGELIVLSADRRAAATAFGQGHISCLAFENDTAIVVCTPSRRVMRVPLSALSFESSQGE